MVSHAKNLRGYIVRIEKVIITCSMDQTEIRHLQLQLKKMFMRHRDIDDNRNYAIAANLSTFALRLTHLRCSFLGQRIKDSPLAEWIISSSGEAQAASERNNTMVVRELINVFINSRKMTIKPGNWFARNQTELLRQKQIFVTVARKKIGGNTYFFLKIVKNAWF